MACGIVFVFYVDYKYFSDPCYWTKNEEMSKYNFRYTPFELFLSHNYKEYHDKAKSRVYTRLGKDMIC